jgi:hypothetical protein
MACDVKLYVYRIDGHQYGAGLGQQECERRGTIVERWPLNTLEQARFLATHGTSYAGASDHVSRIADAVHALMTLDPTYRPDPDVPQVIVIPEPPQPKPGLFERIRSWCFAR